MKIDQLKVYLLRLPLPCARQTPLGSWVHIETVLVCLRSGDLEGWGEASPGNAPVYYAESAASVFQCIRDYLGPRVVGKWIESPQQLQELLNPIVGNQHAKAGIDTAWWDLLARQQNRPIYQLWNVETRAIEVGVSFDRMASIDPLLEAIGRAFAEGMSCVELKLRPGWDASMLNVVRHEFPTQRIHADLEGALGLQHMELLCRLDDFFLAMIEQPLPPEDLVGLAMVQDTIRTPVGLDESVFSVRQVELALELKSGKFVQIKLGQLGGITPALSVHDACHDACTPCRVGTVTDSGIGTRFALAFAGMENCTYPAGILLPEQRPAISLIEPPQMVRTQPDGVAQIILWEEPGIGAAPQLAEVERYQIAQATLTG